MNELTALSAEQLLSHYASGTLTPVEVTRAVLARIAALDSSLNAFCLVDEAATQMLHQHLGLPRDNLRH
jgi:aspartyl-tRNA(Asn)/glutamyl-tRNA(Gln) amidotransferase subunit A